MPNVTFIDCAVCNSPPDRIERMIEPFKNANLAPWALNGEGSLKASFKTYHSTLS